MLYKLSPGISTHDAIGKLTAVFNKYDPAFPYDYSFSDADYASKFNLEMLIRKLAGVFASLAIFISCLGLVGLAAYVAEQCTKEIGIRKVLGASTGSILQLLYKEFAVLLVVAFFIAAPLAWLSSSKWLQGYAFRIDVSPQYVLLPFLGMILIAFLTVSFQSVRAAVSNPVKSLRTE